MGQTGNTPGVVAIERRLILTGQEFGQPIPRLTGRKLKKRVHTAEMGRNALRRLGFIETGSAGIVKSNREGMQSAGSKGKYGSRIKTPTEKKPNTDIADHVGGDGILQG
jgi:hypothetical protein